MNHKLLERLSLITEEEKLILEGQKINPKLYTRCNELIIDSEKLLEAGKLIEIRSHTRFVHFPKHRHNYIEIIYMCQGGTKHIVNGNTVILNEGDLLFLNQSAVHEILPAGETDIAVNFIILPEFFDTAYMMMEEEENLLRDFLMGCLFNQTDSNSYLYFNVADVLPIQNLMENMIYTILNNYHSKRSINQKTMGLLFLNLLNHMDKIEVGKSQFYQEFTVNVLKYIEEHYKNGTLTELSELMGYDLYWLSKEIKKQVGKTFKELLQTKKMNQALYLLKYSSLPVNDIIEAVGYDNTSYFYRKFKERYDISPKEYRLKMKH